MAMTTDSKTDETPERGTIDRRNLLIGGLSTAALSVAASQTAWAQAPPWAPVRS